MALLILVTTTSFSIATHVCAGEVVDIALNEQASTCNMQAVDTEMHELMKKMGCCDDHQIVSDVDDDLMKSHTDLNFGQLVFISAFTQTYSNLFDLDSQNVSVQWIKESPPVVHRDLFLLHDSFLI
jgi:hypothetical protein